MLLAELEYMHDHRILVGMYMIHLMMVVVIDFLNRKNCLLMN